jgi:hypothetical protein
MEKIFSIDDLQSNVFATSDCIVIPAWIFDQLLSLCQADVEYCGQLLCRGNLVEYVFIAGSGNAGSVYPKKKVLFSSTGYSAIEFHTHTAKLGAAWTAKFSDGDLSSFDNRVKQEGLNYQHILFTTENVLTWGKGSVPNVRLGFGNTELVTNTFWEINKKYNCWKPNP